MAAALATGREAHIGRSKVRETRRHLGDSGLRQIEA
jgi:hypothetical protein